MLQQLLWLVPCTGGPHQLQLLQYVTFVLEMVIVNKPSFFFLLS